MNPDTTTQDPEAIERDIRRTQEDMSRTVDKIGDQLTVKNVFNALLDKADESGVDAHYLVDGARRNPMALGLIAAGLIWLVSEKDSKIPVDPDPRQEAAGGNEGRVRPLWFRRSPPRLCHPHVVARNARGRGRPFLPAPPRPAPRQFPDVRAQPGRGRSQLPPAARTT